MSDSNPLETQVITKKPPKAELIVIPHDSSINSKTDLQGN